MGWASRIYSDLGATLKPSDPKYRAVEMWTVFPDGYRAGPAGRAFDANTNKWDSGWHSWPSHEGNDFWIDIFFPCEDSAGHLNNIVDGITPKLHLHMVRPVATNGQEFAPFATGMSASIAAPSTADGVSTFAITASADTPIDARVGGLRFMYRETDAARTEIATNPWVWVGDAKLSAGATPAAAAYNLRAATNPAPGFSTAKYFRVFALTIDTNGNVNTIDWANTPHWDITYSVQAGGLKAYRIDPATVGDGLTNDGTTLKSGTTTPDNWCMNPGFEDGLTHWNYIGAPTIQNSGAYTGEKCARLPGKQTAIYSKFFSVRPGDQIAAECWVKAAGCDTTAYLLIRFRDAAGNQVTPDSPWASCTPAQGTNWTKLASTIPAPNNACQCWVYAVWTDGGTGAGAWLVDNVVCRRMPPVAGGLLFDASGGMAVGAGGGIAVAGGNVTAKTYWGLTIDANGNIMVATDGQGLGFNGTLLRVPTYGIYQYLLANSQIIDNMRLCNAAVAQVNLANAQIIDNARIVDLAVTNYKLGYGSVQGTTIGSAVINDAHINNVSFSKMIAGIATFTGDVSFQNTGSINMFNGGSLYISPGLVSANGGADFKSAGNGWEIRGGSFPYLYGGGNSRIGATMYQYWNGSSWADARTGTYGYKDSAGTNRTLYFNCGLLTNQA